MPGQIIPPLIRWEQNARNGQSPSASFYGQCIHSQNFSMVHRTREVYSMTWPLGVGTGTASDVPILARIRTRHGATRLRIHAILLPTVDLDGIDPRVDVSVYDGSTTETVTLYSPPQATGLVDAPNYWIGTNTYLPIASATTYTLAITIKDYARLGAITCTEEIDATVDPAEDYFNAYQPSVSAPLFDALRERLLAGSVAMWKQGGGTITHWSNPDGTARTRASATLANLIDGSTTGSPATSAPGIYLDNSYRNTVSRSTVAYEMSVLASISASSGSVTLTDSGGTDRISVTVNNATPQWFTATGSLPTAETWYSYRFAGSGLNTLNVWAVSLQEWEA